MVKSAKVSGINHPNCCRVMSIRSPAGSGNHETSLQLLASENPSTDFGWYRIHPGKLTWNPKMEVWKMIFLLNWVIFRFHLNFPGYPQKHMGTPEPEEDSVPRPPLLKGFVRYANMPLPSHSPKLWDPISFFGINLSIYNTRCIYIYIYIYMLFK